MRLLKAATLSAVLVLAACGGGSDGTTTPASGPTIMAFTATPGTITVGNTSVLAWSVSGATSLSISGGVGIVTGSTTSVSPPQTTTYTLTATNASGSASASVTVTVTPAPAPVIASFTASPSTIAPGDASVLAWSASGATSVFIDQGVGAVTGSSIPVRPGTSTTYTLTATNPSGSTAASVTVTVSASPVPLIASFMASPSTITAGESSVLAWSVMGATSVSINQGVGAVTGSSISVTPVATTTYVLTATNGSGSSTSSITVTVTPIFVTLALNVTSPTNASPVPVSGTATPSATVRVFEGTTQLALAVADTAGHWSGALALPDGPHLIKAVATSAPGVQASTPDLMVVVDRKAPTVVSRIPSPGATNVWSRDPITVTFDEELSPPPPGAVVMVAADSMGGQTNVAVDLSLSGRTLTIRPVALPPVPSTITVSLSGPLTDGAGNPVNVPGLAWTWTLPMWQELGAAESESGLFSAHGSAIEVSGDGRPAVASVMSVGCIGADLMEWTGPDGWVLRGYLSGLELPSVAFDGQGHPAMAVAMYSGCNPRYSTPIQFARWGGEDFLSEIISGPAASSASLRVDRQGNHVVAWLEPVAGLQKVFAKLWNGSSWMALGGGALNASSTESASGSFVSLDVDGNARIGWAEGSAVNLATLSPLTGEWAGAAGYYLQYVPTGPIRVGPSGANFFEPYLETTSTTPPVGLLKVRQYPCTHYICRPAILGGEIQGGALNVDPSANATQFALALDGNELPVVAWSESSGAVYVKRWDGTAWRQLGSTLAITDRDVVGHSPAIAVGANGVIAVSFSQGYKPLFAATYVKRYNR